MSVLAKVRTGPPSYNTAIKALVYGGPGKGKTTFAASIPDVLLVDFEAGAHHVDCDRVSITSKKDFDALLEELKTTDKYKCLALDTVDWLQKLIFDDVCKKAGVSNISKMEYGKGYAESQTILNKYLDAFHGLMKAKKDGDKVKPGMDIVILAHAQQRRVTDNPEQAEIDRHTIKLQVNDKGVGMGPILVEWVDYMLYATHDDTFYQDGRKTKARAGERVLKTQGHTYFEAKARRPIPDQIPMDWATFKQHHNNPTKKEVKANA